MHSLKSLTPLFYQHGTASSLIRKNSSRSTSVNSMANTPFATNLMKITVSFSLFSKEIRYSAYSLRPSNRRPLLCSRNEIVDEVPSSKSYRNVSYAFFRDRNSRHCISVHRVEYLLSRHRTPYPLSISYHAFVDFGPVALLTNTLSRDFSLTKRPSRISSSVNTAIRISRSAKRSQS